MNGEKQSQRIVVSLDTLKSIQHRGEHMQVEVAQRARECELNIAKFYM